jgi:hypothetical protein
MQVIPARRSAEIVAPLSPLPGGSVFPFPENTTSPDEELCNLCTVHILPHQDSKFVKDPKQYDLHGGPQCKTNSNIKF